MITLEDIIHHIAQELDRSGDAAPRPGIEGIPAGALLHSRVCITDDVEETELAYLRDYGQGATLYFRLGDYSQGERLANALCDVIPGMQPDIEPGGEAQFSDSDRLYLFLHIRNKTSERIKLRQTSEGKRQPGSYPHSSASKTGNP